MTPLAAALHLAAEGYPVFPCLMNKQPACKGGFHSAKADHYAIEDLWESSPGDLIGVPTGLVFDVLDIDAKHEAARAWWLANRDALPPTRAHRTRSGGLHLLFQTNAGVSCSASKLAPGVDTRARGGYIIWWPAAGFPVLSDAPLASWPNFLLAEFRSKPAPASIYPTGRAPDDRFFIKLVRMVASAHEGERNALTFWCACRAGEMVASGLLDAATAIAVIAEAATRAGLPRTEAERTARSGIIAGGGRV